LRIAATAVATLDRRRRSACRCAGWRRDRAGVGSHGMNEAREAEIAKLHPALRGLPLYASGAAWRIGRCSTETRHSTRSPGNSTN
jgi:hypothetical protein